MRITSILLAASVLLMSACGSSDVEVPKQPAPPTTPAPPAAPAPMLDAFYSFVMNLMGGAEDAEPQAVDPSAPTAPEDTEPVPLGS